MKLEHSIFLAVCILYSGNTQAQFPSFPDSSAFWLMEVNDGPQVLYRYGYHLRSTNHDTLINGTLYSTLWAGSIDQGSNYVGGLRESIERHVYFIPAGSDEEFLLYDFDPVIGETLHVWVGDPVWSGSAPLQFMRVETIELLQNNLGTTYKQIGIMSEAAIIGGQGVSQYWLEGVGGTGGLFTTIGSLTVSVDVSLICMEASGIIWPYGQPGECGSTGIDDGIGRELSIRPNPSSGRFTVEFKDPLMAGSWYSVYDALGKLLYQRPWPAGKQTEELDLSRFGPGTYVIRFTDKEGSCYERVVVD